MSNSRAGLIVLLAKLGPKLFALMIKMKESLIAVAKSSTALKSAGAAGSVGLYGYMFTWEMGIALVTFIAIHEYGHLWGMKRCGIKTKGMYLIPGFGGAAVMDDKLGSAANESFVAIMGPIFGLLLFVVPCMILSNFAYTDMFIAFAVVGTFINLINLLPVMPLDGGRMMKSLSYTHNFKTSFSIISITSLCTALFSAFAGYVLIVYLSIIGFMEIFSEYKVYDKVVNALKTMFRILGWFAIIYFTTSLLSVASGSESAEVSEVGGLQIVMAFFVLIAFVGIGTALVWDIWFAKDDRSGLLRYPVRIIADAITGVKELYALRNHVFEPIDDYDVMTSKQRAMYSILFVVVIVVHIGLLVYLGTTPEGALLGDMFKD